MNNVESWTKILRRNRESFFQWKNTFPPKLILFAKFWAFGSNTWPDSILILRGKVNNLEFEKQSHFLNLLDFQILSQKVSSMVVWNV